VWGCCPNFCIVRGDNFYSVILSDRRAFRAAFGAARRESKDPLFSAGVNAFFILLGFDPPITGSSDPPMFAPLQPTAVFNSQLRTRNLKLLCHPERPACVSRCFSRGTPGVEGPFVSNSIINV
jgi:hypothetical protein